MSEREVARICREMALREPQADSLRLFSWLTGGVDLRQPQAAVKKAVQLGISGVRLGIGQLGTRAERAIPAGVLASDEEYARLTFWLATGVGKTRLMGAIAAYLYLIQRSRHFAFLAPTRTIFGKLERETRPGHPKYLFRGIGGFPMPELFTAQNAPAFQPGIKELWEHPRLFVLTPGQIRPRSGSEEERRLRREGDYGRSFVNRLSGVDDLVLFLDEAHRYGQDAREQRAWAQAISDLKPKLAIEMSATPSCESTVVYKYDLQEALREGSFIKNVVALHAQQQAGISEVEWEWHSLEVALQRLEAKKLAVEAYREGHPGEPAVKPLLLVVCRDIVHAQDVEHWINSGKCADGKYAGKVLRVDVSRSEAELSGLIGVEDPQDPVEVVVNVGMLREGWDVTNVYVIAPLRAMSEETLTTQTIGRGLRLPYGRRVGVEEVDTLDVLCYGKETVQRVIENARKFGIEVREGGKEGPVVEAVVEPARKFFIRRPVIDAVAPKGPFLKGWRAKRNLAVDPSARAQATRIEAVTGNVLGKQETAEMDVANIPLRLGYLLCRQVDEIGGEEPEAAKVFKEYLEDAGCDTPEKQCRAMQAYGNPIVEDVKQQIEDKIKNEASGYIAQGADPEIFRFGPARHLVPADKPRVDLSEADWHRDKNRLIAGWERSLYLENRFDTANELFLARILDGTKEVACWIRNPVGNGFRLDTPAGGHYPDFLVARSGGYVLIEVKRESELRDEGSDAYGKALAAMEWCALATRIGEEKWEYWVVADERLSECATMEDVREARFPTNSPDGI